MMLSQKQPPFLMVLQQYAMTELNHGHKSISIDKHL